jgi:hypothetical protein
MSVVFADIEVAHEFFYVGFKRQTDGLRIGFELSRRTDGWDHERVRRILLANTIVGYNSDGYDIPLIWYAIDLSRQKVPQATILRNIKSKSDAIITSKMPHWEVARFLDVVIPRRCDTIDLKEPQPNGQQTKPGESGGAVFTSLKTLNGRLHGKRMQDLPFDPEARLTDEQMDATIDYCLTSDLDATENLFVALKEPLELRVALGKEYDEDFRSKSDSQIGETIVRKRVEQITKTKLKKVETPPGTTFHYPVPAFMKFDTPALQEILERIRGVEFVVGADGKTVTPTWLKEIEVTIGSTVYSMGTGGLHSTEKSRVARSDEDYVLVDADVTSQYPSIIMALGLFPKSIGHHFLPIYQKIKDERVLAKKNKDKVKDKGMKIALNGVYGKLGSRYSILYAPHLLISVTLTGQLTLLMLIEKAEAAGVQVISGNTDGVLFRCPREMFEGVGKEGEFKDRLLPSALADITNDWEAVTGFGLEFAEYSAIYNANVNNYMAVKADGGHKRIGWYANPWAKNPSDRDERKMLMKNPTSTICSDAALALIKDGTPIEETIYGCTDIKQFVRVVKVDGGGTWRGKYLGKTVRYYWATDGDEILKAKPNGKGTYAKVGTTDGAAPCMTLPDELPDDIDYDRYIAETRDILMALGFTERPPEPMKVRLTKANTMPALLLWGLAA